MHHPDMKKKNRKRKGLATHFAYLGGGGRYVSTLSEGVPRRVTKLLNLNGVGVNERRRIIHRLIKEDGECLARLPVQFERDCDMDELERFLEGET